MCSSDLKSSCEDLGTIQYRTKDGTVVTNSALIDRGFKAGYAINTTGGSRGDSDGGNGGNGATGGRAGASSGGGGGSGYSDGSITIIDTGVGGNTGNSRVNIRLSSDELTGFYTDDQGRILIFSCATHGKDPRTLTKTTGKVMPGTDACIDDVRWQRFKSLAKDGTADWRLAVSKSGSVGEKRTKIIGATSYNIYRMMNANRMTLRTSLTDWTDPRTMGDGWADRYTNHLTLAWDETSGTSISGADYSLLWWVGPGTIYQGYGYFGLSNNKFYNDWRNGYQSAEWWILPPGVPDF